MAKKIESEKAVERELVNQITVNNGFCIKLLCDQCIGLPDRLCLLPGGKIAFVELKTTGKKPRPIQALRHTQLRQLGFRVEVIDTIAGVTFFVKDFLLNECK